MMPLEDPQRLGPERLGTQAHTVHARFGQDLGLLDVERAGIRLDGPFRARAPDQPSPDDAGQPLELGGIQAGGRPTADEDRVHLLRTHQHRRHLALERRQVAIGQVIDSGQRGEVAIAALVGAERDMDVRRPRPLPSRLDIPTLRISDHGTASMKRISGTAAFRVDSTLMLKVTIAEAHP